MSRKLNPKVAAIALLILSFLAAGGLVAKETIAPAGGWGPDPDPPGGG